MFALGARSPAVHAIFRGAVQHQKSGRLAEAERLFRLILTFDPCHADSLHQLGVIAYTMGRHGPAIDMFGQAIAISGTKPSYHANLGNLLRQLGRREAASASYRRALDLAPDYAERLNSRGKALRQLGRPAEALAMHETAVALRPDYAEAFNNRGNALGDLNRPAEALASYDSALAITPDYVDALSNRSHALQCLDRPAEALATSDRALALSPDDAGALINRGNALRDLNRPAEALACFDRALALKPDDPSALNNRGAALRDLDRPEQALACYDRVLALEPGFAEAHCNKGIILTELGRLEQASQLLQRAAEIAPKNARYLYNLAIARRWTPGDPWLQTMRQLARDLPSLGAEDQIYLHFALAKALADIEDHAGSFRHLLDGNRLKRSQTPYDEAATLSGFERVGAAFTADLLRRYTGVGDSSAVPLFILGMPRSGSTLVEQILASHPKVFGAGEIDHFDTAVARIGGGAWASGDWSEDASPLSGARLHHLGASYLARIRAAAPDAERITNKAPENFRAVGLIHLALPNARIIHTRRDPVDTCLSCFSQLFARSMHYTYDLAELGRFYRAYEAIMAHWHEILPPNVLLDLRYEELVADLEGQARRIIAHCGLEWDARCLDFHRTQRTVRTASMTQVRQPIYRSAVGRWRALEPFLGPLLTELRQPAATPAR